MTDVTQILSQIEQGDPIAAERLLPLVYNELRKLAAARLMHEKPGQTLQATALVHDAFIRLVGANDVMEWDNRGHFFAAAARAMQRILVENARRKKRMKAGGERHRIELSAVDPAMSDPTVDILSLDEALDKLGKQHPRKAELVRLRFFAGLTLVEAASALGISKSTADNDWFYAKSWLRVEISEFENPQKNP